MKPGEIFYTDGISRKEKWRSGSQVLGIFISLELFLLLKSSTIEYTCSLAINSAGKVACKYRVF